MRAFATDTSYCPPHLSKSDLYAYDDYCLKVHYGNWDWETARSICIREGGDLVQPRTPGMQEYIRVNLLPQKQRSEEDGFWIGATDLNTESHWRWVSGDPQMPYSNWELGQGPSQSGFLFVSGDLEDCALMSIQDGFRWFDYPCSNFLYHYSFICQHKKLPRSTHHVIPTKFTTRYVRPTTTKYVPPTTTKYLQPATTEYVLPTTTRFQQETHQSTAGTDTSYCPPHLSKSDLYAYGDYCLKVHYGNWDWVTARSICIREGGDLVQPRTPGMQEYIRVNLLPQKQRSEDDGFWIGATDLNTESHWRWVSGDPSMPYSNWEPGEGPYQSGFLFVSGDLEDCALMRIEDGFRWHDYPCSNFLYHYSFICQHRLNHYETTTEETVGPIIG
uniref:Macrophage mannose receptor 1-like n=1 Tax=Crassostrea virginica TaxID=6565 RepID=A0A8B8E7V4_CRAVI|nr:macrophage mannose receptor 1-like [Crassostrea virginica]